MTIVSHERGLGAGRYVALESHSRIGISFGWHPEIGYQIIPTRRTIIPSFRFLIFVTGAFD